MKIIWRTRANVNMAWGGKTQLKIRVCVPAHGTIKLMTWQMLCDLKPRLCVTNGIQLSIG